MAAIEDVGDLVNVLGPVGRVAGGRPQVCMAEAGLEDVHGNPGLGEVRSPVGAQRVRMRQALRNAGGETVALHELVDRLR